MAALQKTTVIVQFSYTSVSFLDTDFTRLQRYDVDVEAHPILGIIFETIVYAKFSILLERVQVFLYFCDLRFRSRDILHS